MTNPRIVVLLSWYDEAPAFLDRALRSLHPLQPRHVVAVDGAYATFPRGRNRSGIAQHEAITRATYKLDAGLTIHVPPTTWTGNEIAKRTALFQLGEHVAHPGDWLMVLDADEELTHIPDDTLDRLAGSPLDVAQVTFHEPDPLGLKQFPIPILFRSGLGIRVIGNHYTYVAADGRLLWGNAVQHRLEPRVVLDDLIVRHYTHQRHTDRRADATAYYRRREATLAEAGKCQCCDRQATRHVAWKPKAAVDPKTGAPGYVLDFTEMCPTHAAEHLVRLRDELAELGIDMDDDMVAELRAGPAPAAA